MHHDISTIAFWALIFLFSEKILAFNLFYKLIIIALGSLFYENNGPILALLFGHSICELGCKRDWLINRTLLDRF